MTKRRLIIAVLTVVVCLGFGVTAASAAITRYVATAANGGNDSGGSNACASAVAPCLTIQNAVGHASAGDTIQIGPGIFPEAVSTATPLSFVGAGAGTAGSFNPATNTAIDASATESPGLTVSNAQASVRGLRVRGGVFDDGNGGEVEPAIWDHSPSSPTLTVSDCLLLQSNPANPDVIDYALLLTGAKAVVQDSLVFGYADGISVSGAGGTLTVDGSTVVTPAPPGFLVSVSIVASVDTDRDPVSITDSTLIGRTGLFDTDANASITRTFIRASAAGLVLRDEGDAPTLTARDSVIGPAAGTLYTGVAVPSTSMSEAEVPAVSLIFDSVLARSDSTAPNSGPPHALDVSQAAIGTHVQTRNTILRAIDTSGAGANDDIVTGSQAINWDLGHTDYTQTAGVGVPPPGSGTNIDALPFYNSFDGSDLSLAPNSALFDAGDPAVVQAGETDVTGAPRAVAHACGAPALPDVGAYEASSPSCPPPTISIAAPANGATYIQGQAVTASYVCAVPAPAIISTCTGSIAIGAPIDTITVGSHAFTVTATANDGMSATSTITYTVVPPVPSLGAIHTSHKTWREGGQLASIASVRHKRKPPVGTTFTFTLNTPATIELTFTHRVKGREVKHRCVAPTRRNEHDRRCMRTVTAGVLILTGHAGTDKITFDGRLSKKHKLAPGAYTLTVIASDSSGQSSPRTTKFTITNG